MTINNLIIVIMTVVISLFGFLLWTPEHDGGFVAFMVAGFAFLLGTQLRS